MANDGTHPRDGTQNAVNLMNGGQGSTGFFLLSHGPHFSLLLGPRLCRHLSVGSAQVQPWVFPLPTCSLQTILEALRPIVTAKNTYI